MSEQAPGAQTTPTEPTSPAPEPAASPAGPDPNTPVDVDSLPLNVRQLITNLRREAAAARTKAKQSAAEQARAEVLQQIAGALGISDAPADPQQLADQLASTQLAEAVARQELEVYRTAVRMGADAERLLDSRRFTNEVSALPEEEFQQKLEDLINEWMARDPSLRVGGAATTRTPVEALRPGSLPASEPAAMDLNAWLRRQAGRR